MFQVRQLVDATSPTLFLPTNPAALRRALNTGGGSVADGVRHLIADLREGRLSRGYLDSSDMANMFNLLRSNDLIWNVVINNYLMGNKPPALDQTRNMRAFEREQVLGAVVAGQRLLDCLDGGVAPRIPHARQHCGSRSPPRIA